MYPIYKFELTINGEGAQRAFPIYKDDLALEFEQQSGEQFFRRKLSGKLTFLDADYARIKSSAFDAEFGIDIYISYNGGVAWELYWQGNFWKTDCEFDEDAHSVVVGPNVKDQYTDILAGLDKEYNLIDLAPAIQSIRLDKRPMIQIYVPGQTVIGCLLSGMWWEQECTAVNETDMVEIEGEQYPALTHKYHFALNATERIAEITEITGVLNPEIPTAFIKDAASFPLTSGDYRIEARYITASGWWLYVVRISDNTDLWYSRIGDAPTTPFEADFTPSASSPATGTFKLFVHDVNIYARYVTDVEQADGITTYPIPDDDLVENNRNYHYVVGYNAPDTIAFNDILSETPTKWGIYQPGLYYDMFVNTTQGIYESYPIARATWGRISYWFVPAQTDWITEARWRKQYTLKNAYPIWSVIQVLLSKIAPDVTFRANYLYSQFLYPYESNPITGIDQHLFITPKSNLVSSGYDEPAQKAPITLKRVFEMLRDCFKCYWFIDDNDRLRIEHISYFMRGGTYDGEPVVGIDLTKQLVSRNGKPWAYVRNQFKYDKPEMPARYQFGWMDDVTELFEGFPIDIISKYVNPENIEQIEVSQFTSDVDYILLNPGAVSKDGFVLLGATPDGGSYKLPYEEFQINFTRHILQNAWVSFLFLQRYYMYDMPARNVEINGVRQVVHGITKMKTQEIRFPALRDPDMIELIKTELGSGTIKKLSLNLSSRDANTTLKYDTE